MDDLFVELLPCIRKLARQFKDEIYGRVTAEDLAQGAALATWNGIKKAGGRDRQAVARYCMFKARGTMIDAFRRELAQAPWRQDDILPSQWEEYYQDAAEREDSAEACASRRQLMAKACRAADTLPADQREVIRRLYIEDQDQTEAGAAMGVTQSRVSQIHSKAIRALRTALA